MYVFIYFIYYILETIYLSKHQNISTFERLETDTSLWILATYSREPARVGLHTETKRNLFFKLVGSPSLFEKCSHLLLILKIQVLFKKMNKT